MDQVPTKVWIRRSIVAAEGDAAGVFAVEGCVVDPLLRAVGVGLALPSKQRRDNVARRIIDLGFMLPR